VATNELIAVNTSQDVISIRGARVHNLKNISLEVPHNAITVVTGVSGSGKSSLAFDTIYAEGQRRYVESLSAYARQFLERMEKPDVDEISGIAPAVAIRQKNSRNFSGPTWRAGARSSKKKAFGLPGERWSANTLHPGVRGARRGAGRPIAPARSTLVQ